MAKLQDFNQRFKYLCLSIIINSAGNALAIVTNMGSAPWTASAVNLSNWLNFPLGSTLFVYGILVTLANQLLLGSFDRRRFVSNLLFTFPFSYLVQIDAYLFRQIGVPQLDIWVRVLLDIFAIGLIGMAVSMYSRANLILHPNDDLAYILRFKYYSGSPVIAQWLSFAPPVVITFISYLATGNLFAIGLGTVLSILGQGSVIKWSDNHTFTKLKHHIDI